MCSITAVELKHTNEKLDSLIDSQKENAAAHVRIEAHIAVSVERWDVQKDLNETYRNDINKVDSRNKIFASLNGIAAIVAGAFGVSR